MNRRVLTLPLIALGAILAALQLAFGLAAAAPATDAPGGSAPANARPAATPVLAISKSGPALAAPASPISYVLTIDNSGTTTATGLVITDRVPANATYLWGGDLSGDVVSWALPALAAGDAVTVGFAVTATQTITNDDYAVSADGGVRAVGTTAVVTEIGSEPVLSIGKTAPAGALPGALITYTLTVTNSGPTTAVGLFMIDELPPGASYVAGGTRFGDLIFWSISALPGNGASISRQFVVTAAQTITNSYYSVAAVGGYEATGDVPVVTVIGYPALTIAKSGPAYARPGAPVTYTLTVSNASPVPAAGLTISDALPVGAAYLGGGTLVGDEVRWTAPELGGGAALTVQFAVSATTTITNGDYVVRAAGGVSATGGISVVTQMAPPLLAIAKSAPAQVAVGAPITYTLTVTNNGLVAATNLVISDVLPLGASYVAGGALADGQVTWTIPQLGPGGDAVVVQFVVTASATISNVAYAVASDGGFGAAGESAVVTLVGTPALAIGKSGPASALPGEPIDYVLTVSNPGTRLAGNVVISDRLPSGATYLSGGTLVGDEVRWSLPSLAPGEALTVGFAVSAPAGATVTNDAYGAAADEGVAAQGTVPVVTLVGVPALVVAKSGPALARQGEPITYTLVVTNAGTAPATGLVITDAVPVGASYLSGGVLSGGEVAWTVPTLDPGDHVSVQFAVAATSTIVNESYGATADGGFGAPPGNPVTTEVRPWLLYLPLLLSGYTADEPNNVCGESHPLLADFTYQFLAEDAFDWYVFELSTPSPIDLAFSVAEFAPQAGALVVYRGPDCATLTLAGQDVAFGAAKVVSLSDQLAGRYYALVVNEGPTDLASPYRLRLTTGP